MKKGQIKMISAPALTRNCLGPELCVALLYIALLLYFPLRMPGQGTGAQGAAPQLLTSSQEAEESLGPVDWIFVIDTSASMSGHQRGFPNIFPAVQDALRRFVPEIRNGDALTVIVFDATSRIASAAIPKTIHSNDDREAVTRLINNLNARGAWTYTGAALKDALNEVSSRADQQRPAVIILFTDGHEDIDPTIKNPIRIPDAVRLIPDQDVPYVFYVSLGTTRDPELLEFMNQINAKASAHDVEAPEHGVVINDPGAQNLPEKARDIRTKLNRLRSQPAKHKPSVLDLGHIRPGEQTGPFSLDLWSPVNADFRITPVEVPADHTLEGIPATIVSGPDKWKTIQFTLAVSDSAAEGVHNYRLEIKPLSPVKGLDSSVQIVPITVEVGWTLWERILHGSKLTLMWIVRHSVGLITVILLLLLILYFLKRWIIDGETPLDVIRRWLRRPHRVPALLRTPEGIFPLAQSITLGNSGLWLKKSPARVTIQRRGDDHYVIVEEGSVTSIDPTGLMRMTVNAGDQDLKLRHKARIMMPGYSTAVEYLNGSSAVRRH